MPALEAMLSETFPNLANVDAAKIALAVQQFLRGPASILGSGNYAAEQALYERLDKQDLLSAQAAADQSAFVQETLSRAERLKLPAEQQAKLRAQARADLTKTIQAIRAGGVSNRLAFDRQIAAMPTEDIIVTGQMVNYNVGGQTQPRLDPEVIRIKHRVWELEPGRTHTVPTIVAERYRQIQRERAETQERKDILRADGQGTYGPAKQDTVVARKFDEISRKYNAPAQMFSRLVASR